MGVGCWVMAKFLAGIGLMSSRSLPCLFAILGACRGLQPYRGVRIVSAVAPQHMARLLGDCVAGFRLCYVRLLALLSLYAPSLWVSCEMHHGAACPCATHAGQWCNMSSHMTSNSTRRRRSVQALRSSCPLGAGCHTFPSPPSFLASQASNDVVRCGARSLNLNLNLACPMQLLISAFVIGLLGAGSVQPLFSL
ncbi:hypothetical protein K431DRAFT_55937 [Polychaeton citri CBS 116435]|uniref:Uncharacterized protein n=1 Tax=Polychaeton citri CBS 116435 TaxID=1314669 RepID=A0A9P4UUM7_9PEZI|nr:hypothetical protein K431DRAFT_55937 [Polychaeton citri CBS 116435]